MSSEKKFTQSEFFNSLKSNLKEDRIKYVLEELNDYLQLKGIRAFDYEVIQVSAQLHALDQEELLGLAEKEKFRIQRNNIRYKLISLISNIEKHEILLENNPSKKAKSYFLWGLLFLSIICVPTYLIISNLKSNKSPQIIDKEDLPLPEPISDTIIKKPHDDTIISPISIIDSPKEIQKQKIIPVNPPKPSPDIINDNPIVDTTKNTFDNPDTINEKFNEVRVSTGFEKYEIIEFKNLKNNQPSSCSIYKRGIKGYKCKLLVGKYSVLIKNVESDTICFMREIEIKECPKASLIDPFTCNYSSYCHD